MNRSFAARIGASLVAFAVAGCVAFGAASPASATIIGKTLKPMQVQHVGAVDLTTPRDFTIFMKKGSTAADAAAVASYFKGYGLLPTISSDHRFVWLRGSLGQAAAAAHSTYESVQITQLSNASVTAPVVKYGPFTRLARPAALPAGISRVIAATTLNPGPKTPSLIQQLPNPVVGFGPADLAGVYDLNPAYAAGLTGAGTTVALPECGIANQKSIDYFTSYYGLAPYTMHYYSVDGTPVTPEQIGLEPLLDAERVIGEAPGTHVEMYFINGDICDIGEFATMLSKIADRHDSTVVSISYGLSEATWAAIGAGSDLTAWEAAIQAIYDDGTPIVAASGDSGAFSDFFFDAIDTLYPASDPNVVAAGGTTLVESAIDTRLIEDGWYYGGGGVSGIFAIPAWQVGVPGEASGLFRNVPDIASDADPNTGVAVLADAPSIGIPELIIEVGGTSVSTPTFAGIYALAAQNRALHGGAPITNLSATLYGLRSTPGVFYDVTTGDNGYYPAQPGYDNVTGLGVPDGWHLIQALQ